MDLSLFTKSHYFWSSDECLNTHHFCTVRMPKTSENTQKRIKMIKISQNSVLYVLNAKTSKSGEKRIKFA